MKSNHENDKSLSDMTKASMRKWPNVPSVYGWLSLDRRGRWLIKNQRVTHKRTNRFLNENYLAAANGDWYVQNGPQKVFVNLEYTPLVFRIDGKDELVSHTGINALRIESIIFDDDGNLLFHTSIGIGVLDDRDIIRLSDSLTDDLGGNPSLIWKRTKFNVKNFTKADIPELFRFNRCPINPENKKRKDDINV